MHKAEEVREEAAAQDAGITHSPKRAAEMLREHAALLEAMEEEREACKRGQSENWLSVEIRPKHEPLVVGDKIVLEDGTEMLVGDVNQLRGVCDCCTERREVVAIRRRGKP